MRFHFYLVFLLFPFLSSAQSLEIYVSNVPNFNNPPWQILKFDGNGENPKTFINSQLSWPQDIVFLEASGVVLISNFISGRITKYKISDGSFIGNFAIGIGGPTRMKIGPDSLLYVLQWSGSGLVKRYDLDGNFVDDFTSVPVSQSIGLDWDSKQNLYVSSYNSDHVRKFDSIGKDLGIFASASLLGPTNIWFDKADVLYVVDYDGTTIKKYDTTGTFIGNFINGIKNAEGVDHFNNGDILLGNGFTGSIQRYDNQGTYLGEFIKKGTGGLSRPNAVVIRKTGVTAMDDFANILPYKIELNQNYPNPFNPKTTITYKLPQNTAVKLSIHNSTGQKVASLINEKQAGGVYFVRWDASGFSSGLYFYKLEGKGFLKVRKMLLLR